MIKIHPERRNITPKRAVRILKKYGEKISLKEAMLMLDLMYNLAILAANQVLSDDRMTDLWTDVKQNALEEQYQEKKRRMGKDRI
ncbi:hypothetical protein OC25_03590 [Pedobacter kyungheensis]|uniref:Uncharacterized protein n=2 Tax=Pedobacter TaxID=84567 RepID=A0A1G6JXR9_9SPHI|nr:MULTISPECIES: hypothetical protein [Pedobacter]KIA96180.1 hypothetical protein OC25_03590 [Pedobacter kyungheensis]SDC23493.1 hypothetical protein SAMN04488024_101589 [Pedobacter soli]